MRAFGIIAGALLLLAAPAEARKKRADAVAAAEAAKDAFHDRNAPSGAAARAPGTFSPTRSITVEIVAIKPDGTLVIEDPETGRRQPLDPRALPEIVAQDRSRFGGRKKLEAADLAAGHRLKITIRVAGAEIVKAKVLRDRAAP